MRFYEVIDTLDLNSDNYMATVCEGEYAGEKMIVTDGECKWQSSENGFFASHPDAFSVPTGCDLKAVDGVRVFTEKIGKGADLVICGAGHVSMPIISIGKMMGCSVTVIEDRLSFANNAIERGADRVIFKDFESGLEEVEGGKDSYFVIVTRGHRHDMDCLRAISKKPFAYVGMMGSRKRVAIVKKELEEEGLPKEFLESIHAPIGLDIGSETPEEIAVAVMAEIISIKNREKKTTGLYGGLLEALMNEGREPAVMATIISRHGSAPREAGTRTLIWRDGRITGTIGGGCIEGNAIAKGRRMLMEEDHTHAPVTMEVDMSKESAEDEGMVCGGNVELLLEVV